MFIKIHSISKPDRWYSELKGQIFKADPSLFGYTITEGEFEGKMIYRKDAGRTHTPRQREGFLKRFKVTGRAKPSPSIKTSENGPQKAGMTLLRSKHVEKSMTPEEWRIEQQIKEYAKNKRERRA